jgi:putative acetyltransferase
MLFKMDFSIREIEKTDNETIRQVIRTVLEEHSVTMPGTAYYDDSLNHMFESYTGGNKIYYLGIIDGKIVGGAGIFPTEGLPADTCELVKMYLLPQARGLGLGKALVNKCLDFATAHGYKKVYLETMPELQNAVHMYEKMGFNLLKGPMGNTGHFACTLRMLKNIS